MYLWYHCNTFLNKYAKSLICRETRGHVGRQPKTKYHIATRNITVRVVEAGYNQTTPKVTLVLGHASTYQAAYAKFFVTNIV